MNSFGKLVAAMMAIVVLFIVPQIYFSQKIDSSVQLTVDNTVTKFVDDVRASGFVTVSDYEQFIRDLDSTGQVFDIRIDHLHTVYDAVYEVSGDFHWYQEPQYTPAAHLDPDTIVGGLNDDGVGYTVEVGPANSDTNVRVQAEYSERGASGTHRHTDDCYDGHRHSSSCYTQHTHTNSCYSYEDEICGSTYDFTYSYNDSILCPGCGSAVLRNVHRYVCNRCRNVVLRYEWVCDCGRSENTKNDPIGTCTEVVGTIGELVCDKVEGLNLSCGQAEDTTPVCNRIVRDVALLRPNQTVVLGAQVISVIEVTYLDGSTSAEIATANRGSTSLGTFEVTFTWTGYNTATTTTQYSRTGTVTITESVNRCNICSNTFSGTSCPHCTRCSVCQKHYLRSQGSCPWHTTCGVCGSLYQAGAVSCPYCSTCVICNMNYDGKGTCPWHVVCGTCGNWYYRASPSGCPYCVSSGYVWTGETTDFQTLFTEDDVLEELYTGSGAYAMEKGDQFTVTVTQKTESMFDRFNLLGGVTTKRFEYGGRVRE